MPYQRKHGLPSAEVQDYLNRRDISIDSATYLESSSFGSLCGFLRSPIHHQRLAAYGGGQDQSPAHHDTTAPSPGSVVHPQRHEVERASFASCPFLARSNGVHNVKLRV